MATLKQMISDPKKLKAAQKKVASEKYKNPEGAKKRTEWAIYIDSLLGAEKKQPSKKKHFDASRTDKNRTKREDFRGNAIGF